MESFTANTVSKDVGRVERVHIYAQNFLSQVVRKVEESSQGLC